MLARSGRCLGRGQAAVLLGERTTTTTTTTRLGRAARATWQRSYAAAAPSAARDGVDYTVSESSAGFPVASTDNGSPTSAVSVIIKAGSRYESSPGLAHALKAYAFKNTTKRTALRITRETELLGGQLSSTLSREYIMLTAEFLRPDLPYFVEVLADVVTKSRYTEHEYKELIVSQLAHDYHLAQTTPEIHVMDLAHQLAFRQGLGNSLYANPYQAIKHEDVVAYAKSALTKENLAVVASGADASEVTSLVNELFADVRSSAGHSALMDVPSKYFGGEHRLSITTHGGRTGAALVAFPAPALEKAAAATVLRFALGGESSIKWTTGTTPLSANTKVGSATAISLAYQDAGLFGIYVKAPTEHVKEVATTAIGALKKIASSGISSEELKRAVNKAKFGFADLLESRNSSIQLVGTELIRSGGKKLTSLSDAFAQLDAVKASDVKKAAETMLKSKPTSVIVGNTHVLPYADELGL